MATVYYEKDADRSKIADRKVAILGYGSQGHAHALNLHESGVDVRMGLRDGSSSRAKAEEAGLRVLSIADASAEADLIMILLPDTEQQAVFESDIKPNLNPGDAIFFAHGFSGHGALVTTLAGELMAEALAGTAERFDVLANLPSRPFPGGKWLRRPLATLGLLWYALRDRLG